MVSHGFEKPALNNFLFLLVQSSSLFCLELLKTICYVLAIGRSCYIYIYIYIFRKIDSLEVTKFNGYHLIITPKVCYQTENITRL
jgi:hypothetical protein